MNNGKLKFKFILTDFLAAALAWIYFFIFRKYLLDETQVVPLQVFIHSLLIGIVWVAIYTIFGFYTEVLRISRAKTLLSMLSASFLGSVAIFFVLLLDDKGITNYLLYYKTFTAYYIIHFLFAFTFKVILVTYVKNLIRSKKLEFNTLLIGSSSVAKEIFDEVEGSYDPLGMKFIGYVYIDESSMHIFNGHLKRLGDYRNLAEIIKEKKVEQVILAVETEEHGKIPSIMEKLEGSDIRINIANDLYPALTGSVKMNHVFDIPLIEVKRDLMPVWQKICKRAIDIVASLLVLTVGSPFLLTVSLITKLTSKGPVIFTQERIGRDGVPFRIYKFRSMYVNAEEKGPALSSQNDPRITPWGRIMRRMRIDEFPQFYNVLIGEMSLVGPRPERKYYIDQIVKYAPHYKHLYKIKPGITSLGQVKFGYAENVEEMVKRMKYDIIYLENISLIMDLRIIFYTLVIMFEGRGK